MDELEQFLGGTTTKERAAPSAAPSVVTDQLLDSLRKTESGKDRFALNKQTKAMGPYQFMPETVQMLHKQGIEFNPFNEKEARNAAKMYLERLVAQNKGDLNKALANYGGFVTKDPTEYVNKVVQGQQNAPQQQSQSQPAADELEAFLSGKPASKPAQQQAIQPETQAAPQEQGGITGVARNLFNKTAQTAAQGVLTLPQQARGFAASALDTLAGVPNFPGYIAGRAFGLSPEEAQSAASKVPEAIAQPIGRMTGLAQTKEYQKALPTQIQQFIGENFQKGAKYISEKTGVPEQDVAAAMETGLFIGGPAAVKGGKKIVQGAQKLAGELEVVPTQMQEQFAAKQAAAGSAGAAKAEFNPYAGQITGEETVRGQFPQIKLSKTPENVKPQEQITRAQIARQILQEGGVDANQVRPGVVTGNENTLRNEYTEAKSPQPTPKSELLKKQIANEQIALSNFAQKRIDNTGASPTLVTPYERGERINSTFAGDEGLTGFFKQEKRNLYDEARNRTGDNPIQSSNVENLFANKQFKAGLGLKGNEGVARSAEELINHAKTIGFEDDAGNVYAPNTVGAWTAVQKSLNSNWTPQNASIIRKINQAIERDIGAAGGLDLLKRADELHQAEKVLFGSKGIKQIFGDIDPNGVQTATAFEAIPQKLNSMPVDQWKHIYETAEKIANGKIDGPVDKNTGMPKWSIPVPEELRVSAQSAMNEMKGNIAREIYQAGAGKAGEWNQNAVNKILNARADKIKVAFSPEEQQAFHTLNVGGYLMPGVHGYEGAGLQTKRVEGIIEGNLPKMGAAAGAAVGTGLLGPGVGTAVGGYVGGKLGASGQASLAERHMIKESKKLKKEMQKTSEKGKNSLQDIRNMGSKE